MNELLTTKSEEVSGYFTTLTEMREEVHKIITNFRPLVEGEIYLTSTDVCELLHITLRTLQEYRDSGILPYIQFPGKILYKQSDILAVLEQNYVSRKS